MQRAPTEDHWQHCCICAAARAHGGRRSPARSRRARGTCARRRRAHLRLVLRFLSPQQSYSTQVSS